MSSLVQARNTVVWRTPSRTVFFLNCEIFIDERSSLFLSDWPFDMIFMECFSDGGEAPFCFFSGFSFVKDTVFVAQSSHCLKKWVNLQQPYTPQLYWIHSMFQKHCFYSITLQLLLNIILLVPKQCNRENKLSDALFAWLWLQQWNPVNNRFVLRSKGPTHQTVSCILEVITTRKAWNKRGLVEMGILWRWESFWHLVIFSFT